MPIHKRPPKKTNMPLHLAKVFGLSLACFLIFQTLGPLFLLIYPEQAEASSSPRWYNTAWKYRKPIVIDNRENSSSLARYQVKVELNSSNFDFSKADSDGSDIIFTDSDGTTLLSYYAEDYDSTNQTATLWPEVPTIPAFSQKTIYMYYGLSDSDPRYFRITIHTSLHSDYGAAYPLTYEFSLSTNSGDLRVYKRYSQSEPWTLIPEKTSEDFFNGVEAVRFDNLNNRAYVSVAFDDSSDEIQLKITNSSGEPVEATYLGVSQYYDNRDAAVTATGDDWYGTNDTAFANACDAFTSRRIWFSPAIVTQGGRRGDDYDPPDWNLVQAKIDAGYIEPISHGREHIGRSDYFHYRYTGTHIGPDDERYTLIPSGEFYPTNADYDPSHRGFKDWILENITDGSSCVITSNTTSTITCAAGLSGGIENDWDTGDIYVIDRYDEEIGGSKQDLIDNLDLPALNKRGAQEYVYAWAEPYGYSDSTIQTKVSEYKYLVDRSIGSNEDSFAFASYSGASVSSAGHYRIGGSLWLESSNLETANNKFDSVVAAGGIYHMMMHPVHINWSENGWVDDHLDYISGKKNIWYVGFGHLFLYHFLAGKVTVRKVGQAEPSLAINETVSDDFSSQSLNQEWWVEEVNNGDGTVNLSGSAAILNPEDNVTNNVGIRSTEPDFTAVRVRFKAINWTADPYFIISIGSGDVIGVGGSDPQQDWWISAFESGYYVWVRSTRVSLYRIIGGNKTQLGEWNNAPDPDNFHIYELLLSSSGVIVKRYLFSVSMQALTHSVPV